MILNAQSTMKKNEPPTQKLIPLNRSTYPLWIGRLCFEGRKKKPTLQMSTFSSSLQITGENFSTDSSYANICKTLILWVTLNEI